jgi:Dolichyl-phosphate-mannose-protein mannosyltransferase
LPGTGRREVPGAIQEKLMEGQPVTTRVDDAHTPVSDRGRDLKPIALLLLLAVTLRGWVMFNAEVVARDSIGFIRYALAFETDSWSTVLRNNHQHPGYPLTILAVSLPVRAVSTSSEPEAMAFSAQLASNLAAVLLVVPMYFLGKMLFHQAAGFGGAALFQCLPVPAHILSDGLSESLFLLLACATLTVTVLALRGNKAWQFALAGLFCGLSYLTRPEGVLLLGAALLVLVGLQFANDQRRSMGQLLACGLSMTGVSLAVGSPYLIATHSVSNKPSVYQWFGKDLSDTEAVQIAPQLPDELPDPRPGQRLLASTFAIALNLQDTTVRRAGMAVWAICGELAKCYHYALWVPVLLGMWWFRQRAFQVPGLWVVQAACVMLALVLWRLAVIAGYLSDRHLMLLVMCGCLTAAAAVWELPARWAAWRGRQPIPGTALPKTSLVAILLLCSFVVAGLPKSLEKLHGNRAGHHAAGLWLAQNAAPADIIEDNHSWAHYYAGRVFQETHPVVAEPGHVPARYVVVGRRDHDITPTWNNPGQVDEGKLQSDGGQIVFHWPNWSAPSDAPVVVYVMR